MSGPSVAMFHESPSGNVEKSKLINSGQNTTCNEQNNHFYMGSSGGENVVPNVISCLQTLAQHLARTSNNQSTGADDSESLPQAVDTDHSTQLEGYPVDVCDIVPPDPSAFPVATVADRYTRSMLEFLVGYPLYEPEPFSDHSTTYLCNGINIGDVGFVREDGTFEFLFNICPPQNSSINPPNLPKGFSLEIHEHSKTRKMRPFSRGTCFFPSTVTKTKSGKYICKGPEGAILVLPEGAIQDEAINRERFEELAKRHGVEWYEYTKTLGRSISNGSLYLITSFTKCTQQWGIAVFHRSCDPGQGLKFGRKLRLSCCNSTPKYHWKGASACITKVANPNRKDAPNQCVFLRGYKIMIRKDIFDNLCNHQLGSDTPILSSSSAGSIGLTQQRQRATRIRGGGPSGTDLTSIFTRNRTQTPTTMQLDAVVLHPNFNSSPIHPSDLINVALLSQNPDAKIALTHDDVWCDLLRDNFPKLNPARLADITRSYTSAVDEYDCISLDKFSDSINDESSSSALQGPIQQRCPTTPNEENSSVVIENPVPSVQEKNNNLGRPILYEVHKDTVIFRFGDGHYTEQERGMIRDYLSNVTAFTLRDIYDVMDAMKSHSLTRSILNLPNPQAAYGDYQIRNRYGSRLKGTRAPLLQEMADWISGTDKTRMCILSGPAEIGKSTVAYTIAARADTLGLLGASYFFSRDGAYRDNGKMFFTAIAYQLCLYNGLFAKATEAALLTKPLSDATMKDPQEQLEALILEPLRYIVRSRIRPILIVVDELDECDEEDGVSILTGLRQLVRDLPSFKVILTTRPQSYFDRFFHIQDDHKIFHLQDKIINDNAQSDPQASPSQELAIEQLQNRAEGGHVSDTEDKVINDNTRSYRPPSPPQELAREQLQDRAETGHASDIEGKAINDDSQPSSSQEVAKEQLHDCVESGHTSDIEDQTINDDTHSCLQLGPSQQLSREQMQDQAESGLASDTWIGSFVRGIGSHVFRTDISSIPFSENFNTGNLDEVHKIQPIVDLPRAQASHKDHETKNKSGPCFPGTREALLREMMDWMTEPGESKMYVLSGLAGVGKSTVVYTLATQAAELGLLGASFFFSRDESDRRSAARFFSTIAFQLCVYDETFSKAIGDVLLTEHGATATSLDPQTQLQVLILDPLQSIFESRYQPLLIVVDALDECDEEDKHVVVMGLSQLVQLLPSFKVILTTRPQPLVDHLFRNHDGYKVFQLQNIEDKVVDGDIRPYLQYHLSLEQVQRHYPKQQWCANDEEIDSLVHAAGRLFLIASTSVRYIFDTSASNPAAQMQNLLRAFAQDHASVTPFKDIDQFYTVILRNVIPANCDDDDIVSRYQSVVGAITLVQRPLPSSTLAHLIGVDAEEIHVVLDHLQSVILLGSGGVPRTYHISFPDYLTDQARCKDPRLRIDPRIHHIQIVTRCFEIMDKHLKRNILGLADPAQFMSNQDGLKEEGITDEQLQEKIPRQLRYACVYWANHLEVADIEDANLMNGLAKFVNEHMLHWLEVLSLIGNLGSAHRAIRVVLKLLTSTPSDLVQLLFDGLRFISKFYKLIERSALHTYHSALPFTPTDSLLYHRYIKEAGQNTCSIEGGPEKWDGLVANLSHGEQVDVIKFSLDGTMFVSYSQGKSKIWDAATGTPISTIPGHRLAVANDFSTVASSKDDTITFYNVNGSARGTIFTTSSKIQKLALSSESSRVAAALSDGTVWLWESRNAELIDRFDGFGVSGPLQFSPTGTRLAYSSASGIKLRDGISGRSIADLQWGSWHSFEFSSDGSRIASVSRAGGLTLWNSENGGLIAAVKNVGQLGLAISANGSLLATANRSQVTLWGENRGHLAQIKDLQLDMPHDMAFSLNDSLAIATSTSVMLYDVETHSFIYTLPFGKLPTALAFSPDRIRFAIGTEDGRMHLWDIRNNDTSSPSSHEDVTAVALSQDCSRLACGFVDGRIELWGTRPTKVIRSHQAHMKMVRAFGFGPGGGLFASGSDDGTIYLWKGKDGSLQGTLNAPSGLQAVALSNSVVVATGNSGITLWSLDTLRLVYTFKEYGDKVSIAENNTLTAVFLRHSHVALLDVANRTTIATFHVPFDIHTMTFLPDNSQLVVQSDEGVFLSLNLVDKRIITGPTIEHLIQLPNTSLWHGVPIWHCQDKEQHYFAALFSQHNNPVPVLWIPRQTQVTAWTQGSSMIALACKDGRVILLRLPTSYAG